MEDAATILVIITSSLLAIILVLGIVLAVFLIKLVKSIRQIVARGEEFIDSAEAAAETIKSVSGPLSMIKLVHNIISMVNDHKKSGRK